MVIRANKSSLALLLICLIAQGGCGGGSGSGSPGGGGGGTGDSRAVLLDTIATKFETFTGTDPDADNQQMHAFLQSKPEFVETGRSPDGAWGKFADGTMLVVCNNVDADAATREAHPPLPTRGRSPRNRAGGIPSSPNIILGTSLGSWFEGYIEPRIPALFLPQDYVRIQPDSSVDALKSLDNVSVLHLFGHGGVFDIRKPAPPIFVAWTSTLRARDGSTDAAYSADLHDGSLIYFMSSAFYTTSTPAPKKKYETHYGFTSKFVTKHWAGKFDADSIVFMNNCRSAAPESLEFEFAVLNAGASIYLGWSDRMKIRNGINSAAYLFDRLLGSNSDTLTGAMETPPQRAFGVTQVLAEMHTRRRNDDPYSFDSTIPPPEKAGGPPVTATLMYLTLGGPFQQLAPSIEGLEVNEQDDELIVSGVFGSAKGQVKIKTTPLTVKTWTANRITCMLPRTGTNSSGTVRVVSASPKLESNVVPLTEWNGPVTCTVEGKGTLKMVMTFNVHFRADVQDRRIAPHETPFRVGSGYLQARDTSGTYLLSGTYTSPDGTYTESWSGSGSIPSFIKPPTGTSPPEINNVVVQGSFDEDRKWSMAVRAVAKGANSLHTITRDTQGKVTSDKTEVTDAVWLSVDDLNGHLNLLTIGPDFSVPAGSRTRTINADESITLSWGSMAVKNGPNNTSARSTR